MSQHYLKLVLFLISTLSLPVLAENQGPNCANALTINIELPIRDVAREIERATKRITEAKLSGQNLSSPELERLSGLEAGNEEVRVNTFRVAAYRAYKALMGTTNFEALMPPASVYPLLERADASMFAENFETFLKAFREATIGNEVQRFHAALQSMLTDIVPARQIEERIQAYRADPTPDTFLRLMGDMTFAETTELLLGPDVMNPNPDSLVGKYRAATNASMIRRTFDNGYGVQGQERWVVAVNSLTQVHFKKFFRLANFLLHYHTPTQGTLLTSHENKVGTYSNNRSDLQINDQYPGTVIPLVLLDSYEGQRARLFYQLGREDENKSKYPWNLPPETPNQPYSAASAFTCCTFWFGNIPVGRETTNEYWFPGFYNTNVPNTDPSIVAQAAHRPLNNHSGDLLSKLVWTNPGHLQLSEVLGLRAQNLAGEFAAPGWVGTTLVGSASAERVPIVFLVVPDVAAPIDPNFDPRFNRH